jgi:hypothetical protein
MPFDLPDLSFVTRVADRPHRVASVADNITPAEGCQPQ